MKKPKLSKGMTSEQVAEELIKLGFEKPDCFNCMFIHRHKKNLFGSCSHPIAAGINAIAESVRQSQGGHSLPLFPVITFTAENEDGSKEVIDIPSIIASPVGVAAGAVKWPEYFDPIHILFCVFYGEDKHDQRED